MKSGGYMDVEKYLVDIFCNDCKIVVAVSGGPDSMYLLHVLLKVRLSKNIKIIVAHVNHNMRKASELEKMKVEEYCRKNDLIFEYLSINKYNHDNFHSYSRKIRYKFFFDLVKKYDAKYLLTAHHGDDLMETILMRIMRGSTVKGYKGFSIESDEGSFKILRPLIYMTKEQIKNYMDVHHLWYALDESNFKDVYTRNRYRKYILPILKNENKNAHLKFLEFSKKISLISNFFDKYVDSKYGEIVFNKKINNVDLKKEDRVVINSIIYKYFNEINNFPIEKIVDKNIDNIYNCINSSKPNCIIDLPGGFQFVKSYDLSYIKKKQEKVFYKYELVDNLSIKGYGIFKYLKNSNENNNNIIYLSNSDIKLPLYVRNRNIADFMYLKNCGKKKIKDIFIECKIPIDQRDNYPIVVDSDDNIIWVPGLKKSKFDRKNSLKYDIILKYN